MRREDEMTQGTTADAGAMRAPHSVLLESFIVDTETGLAAPAELSEERVKTIFSSIATQYERFNRISSFGQDHRWLNRLIDMAPITPDSRVLDVAGGTGEVTFAMCRRNPPRSVVLSDYTPSMLDMARLRLDRGDARGVDVSLRVIDAQDIPFPDDSFDVVTMAYGIRNIPDRSRALSEILRVLKPGGTFVVLEFSHPRTPVERAIHSFYLNWGIPAWGWILTRRRDDFVYLARSIKAFPNQERFKAMLEQTGFEKVDYCNLTFGAVAVHRGMKPLG